METPDYLILLCIGGNCATGNDGEKAWKYLQRRVKELELRDVKVEKKMCLGVCALGPTLAVMPEGTWYHRAHSQIIEQILQEHIIKGKPVKKHAFSIKENLRE